MQRKKSAPKNPDVQSAQLVGDMLPKTLTGIEGLDVITEGGLPCGRTTLVCGGPGTGKSMLALEFLVRGITHHQENGVLMAFEERTQDIINNAKSLGFDLQSLIDHQQLVLDFVLINPEEIVVSGAYDLDALFIRLGEAIDRVGAKRVVLDTVESLFSGLPNPAVLRAELRRLFIWLKDKGVTAILTGESAVETLTREGLEEYVSDCVIKLDLKVENRLASRNLRIIKYRGSSFGSNEYPFIITGRGFKLFPITAGRLDAVVSSEIVSSGVAGLDAMFDTQGYYRGSSILVSGSSGTGKSVLLASFARSACQRGERVLYFSFEESPSQIIRNMRSVGLDLAQDVQAGLLEIDSARSSQMGLELHLLRMQAAIESFQPCSVVIDPITSLLDVGSTYEIKRTLDKLINFVKRKNITLVLGSLTPPGVNPEFSTLPIASIIDTWIVLAVVEGDGERNRALYIQKSRGMGHSNKVREFKITPHGIEVCDVFYGQSGVLVGRSRLIGVSQAAALGEQGKIDRG